VATTATAKAAPGTYSFYVEQLATAGQVSYNVSDSVATNAGAMNVVLADGSTFQVDLANADNNMDGVLSAKEVAAAINAAANNNSRVTASTMTVNGQTRLVLTSAQTGADNAVASIDVSGLGDAGLQAACPPDRPHQPTPSSGRRPRRHQGRASLQHLQVSSMSSSPSIRHRAPAMRRSRLTVAPTPAARRQRAELHHRLQHPAGRVRHPDRGRRPHGGVERPTARRSRKMRRSTTTPACATCAIASPALRSATGGQSLINFGISASQGWHADAGHQSSERTIAANPGSSTPCSAAPASASTAACWAR
jgi:flagellar hook-associated protein 2